VIAAGTDVPCHSEQLTGTMIGKAVCTTKAQRDAQQAAVERIGNEVIQTNTCRVGAACGQIASVRGLRACLPSLAPDTAPVFGSQFLSNSPCNGASRILL
jgi:hypothetical protein